MNTFMLNEIKMWESSLLLINYFRITKDLNLPSHFTTSISVLPLFPPSFLIFSYPYNPLPPLPPSPSSTPITYILQQKIQKNLPPTVTTFALLLSKPLLSNRDLY